MSLELQRLCLERQRPFELWTSQQSEPSLSTAQIKQVLGLIDFSKPDSSVKISEWAQAHRLPIVCGTTGWPSPDASRQHFLDISSSVPVVLDYNFSQGIEIVCQLSEILATKSGQDVSITDLHHRHKKDSPSGTALKIKDRILRQGSRNVATNSVRLGDMPGEHRVLVSFDEQTVEIIHRAHSRRPFAQGALYALDWAAQQIPGLYSMEDILK